MIDNRINYDIYGNRKPDNRYSQRKYFCKSLEYVEKKCNMLGAILTLNDKEILLKAKDL